MKKLKLALLGATCLIGAGALTTAQAADVYARGSLKDSGQVAYMPAITWTGFYFGVHAGAAFDDDDDDKDRDDEPKVLVLDDHDNDDDDWDWLAGVHVGYNWQKSSGFVLGIEGDVSFLDDIDYLASIRGRLGYAMGPTLLYVTGGWAWASIEDDFGDDDTVNGWVAGLGIEHKLGERVSLGLEGVYYDLDDTEHLFHSEDNDFWTIRARLTYHMGGRHAEPLK